MPRRRDQIPRRLHELASARERRAARDAATARRALREAEVELEAIHEEHETAESELVEEGGTASGGELALLALGREGFRRERDAASAVVDTSAYAASTTHDQHVERLGVRRGKEALLESVQREQRGVWLDSEDKERDDRTGAMHDRGGSES